MDTDTFLSAAEVAKRVGRSRSQVNRDAAQGKIATHHTVGGARAFTEEAVSAYIGEQA